MGEYADDEIFGGIDDWRGTPLSHWPGDYPPQYYKKAKHCFTCKKFPLYWQKWNGTWRLYSYENGEYKLHNCSAFTVIRK
jgi:hypothetical protein